MPEHSTTRRAVGYYRASSDKQDKSVPEQRGWARRACEREGLHLASEHADDGISGGEIDTRAGLAALLAQVEADAAGGTPSEALVVWDLDRLSRADSLRTAAVLARLMDAGCHAVLTAEGWVDLTDSTQRILHNLKQDLGRNQFLVGLARNTLRGQHAAARDGRRLGRAPFGYSRGEGGRLVPGDPPAVAAVRGMFERYAAGASLTEVVRWLDVQGVPPPASKAAHWSRPAVRHVLCNRAYAGDHVWNACHTGKHGRVKRGVVSADDTAQSREADRRRGRKRRLSRVANVPEDVVVVENAHPPLVSRELWAAAQARRKKTSAGRGKSGLAWALSPILHCGTCGGKMQAMPAPWKKADGSVKLYRYYRCTSRRMLGASGCALSGTVEHDWALAETFRLLQEQLGAGSENTLRGRLVKALSRGKAEARAKAGGLRARLAELAAMLKQGNRNLALVSPDRVAGVEEQLREWEQEAAEARARLAACEEAEAEARIDGEAVERAVALFSRLGQVATGDPAGAREALAPLVERVTVHFREATPEDRKGGARGNPRARPEKIVIRLAPAFVNLLRPSRRSCL